MSAHVPFWRSVIVFGMLVASRLGITRSEVAAGVIVGGQNDSLPVSPLSHAEKVVSFLQNVPGVTRTVRTTIRDEADWNAFWDKATEHGMYGGLRTAPAVDFAHEMLVVASNGPMRNYDTIRIAHVERDGDNILVRVVTQTHVYPGCEFFMDMTPVAIVRVARDTLPVKFTDQRTDEKCVKH